MTTLLTEKAFFKKAQELSDASALVDSAYNALAIDALKEACFLEYDGKALGSGNTAKLAYLAYSCSFSARNTKALKLYITDNAPIRFDDKARTVAHIKTYRDEETGLMVRDYNKDPANWNMANALTKLCLEYKTAPVKKVMTLETLLKETEKRANPLRFNSGDIDEDCFDFLETMAASIKVKIADIDRKKQAAITAAANAQADSNAEQAAALTAAQDNVEESKEEQKRLLKNKRARDRRKAAKEAAKEVAKEVPTAAVIALEESAKVQAA